MKLTKQIPACFKKNFRYIICTILVLTLISAISFGNRSKTENIGNADFVCFWDGSAPVIQFDVTRTRTWSMWIFMTKDEIDFNRGKLHPEGCYCKKLDVKGMCEWY